MGASEWRQVSCEVQPEAVKEARVVRANVAVDEELLEKARRITGIEDRTDLVHTGLRALIQRESARWLARLGGSEPGLQQVHRRRPESA